MYLLLYDFVMVERNEEKKNENKIACNISINIKYSGIYVYCLHNLSTTQFLEKKCYVYRSMSNVLHLF